MSKLYKKVTLFVSRTYYHGGDGLEVGSLIFFKSMEEYEALSKKNNWERGSSFKHNWCVKPIQIIALVNPKDYRTFLEGCRLSQEKVFFPANILGILP